MRTTDPLAGSESTTDPRDEDPAAFSSDYDGAPYCSYGHKTKASCNCEPIAENE